MGIVHESKLTSQERKELPDGTFGLPEDRAYPLHDEEHVRKAIQFFKYCKPVKKNALANNINKRAKELGLKLRISKENPFYKYADKNIVQEVSLAQDGFALVNESVEIPSPDCIGKPNYSIFENLLSSDPQTMEEMINIEKCLSREIIPKLRASFGEEVSKGHHLINPIALINKIMSKVYHKFLYFHDYMSISTELSKIINLTTGILDDITYAIDNYIYRQNVPAANIKIKLLEDICNNFNCNIYLVERLLEQLIFACHTTITELKNIAKTSEANQDEKIEKVNKIMGSLRDLSIRLLKDEPNVDTIIPIPRLAIGIALKSDNLNFINTENFLNTTKNEMKNEINIILMSNMMGCSLSFFGDDKPFFLNEVSRGNREIYDIIDFLTGSLCRDNIRRYNTDFTLTLDAKDIMVFSELKEYITSIYPSTDRNGERFYYGVNENQLFLLGKNVGVTNQYILVKLYDGECMNAELNFLRNPQKMTPVKIITINLCSERRTPSVLTEGITIDKDGNMKFEFKPRKTYMDEYSENHKLLLANSKAKNYEGMKKNLAFLFAMITTIERDVIYKKDAKIKPEKKKDAEKARTFAINDFKTYLKEVQKAEPGFDFAKYYDESGYGKLTINVTRDSIEGIKKILRTIMIS